MNNTNISNIQNLLNNFIYETENPEHSYKLGEWYESMDHTSSASTYYMRAAERSKNKQLSYIALIRVSICYQKQGLRDHTEKTLLENALIYLPERPEAYYLLSLFYEKKAEWHTSYIYATLGLRCYEKDVLQPINIPEYPGKYALIFQKAVASWWWGRGDETRDLLLDLYNNYWDIMSNNFKNLVQLNAERVKLLLVKHNDTSNLNNKKQDINNIDQEFDWGNLNKEYIELFTNENFVDKIYEKHREVKPNDIVFDIGANYGSFTYSILDKKPSKVYCVEPSNTVVNYLMKNIAHGPVIVINKAISDKEGIETIPKNGVYINDHQGELYSAITFQKIIDDYNISKIDFLKFDCEGGEYSIFTTNNYNFIRNNVSHCAGEWHINDHDNAVEKFIAFRDLYLKDCCDLHVYERNGKDVTIDIFDDEYLYRFRDWWKNTDLGQFIIYFSYRPNLESSNMFYNDSHPNEENGIIDTNRFFINSSQNKRFFVVDNFYEDPYEVRKFALSQLYFPGEGGVGHRTRKQFLFDGLKEKFEDIIRQKIPDHTDDGCGWRDIGVNGRFQYCSAGTNLVYHCDAQNWAAMVFLTPDAPPSAGTSFFRHRETKIYHASQIDWNTNGNQVFNGHTFLDRTPYENIDNIGNIFNRLVIFDGKLIHSASDYFGWDINSSRLFHIFFFN